jgi:tyrosinase
VQIHLDRMTADSTTRVGHQGPSFLPWHRRYLLDFERRLQAIDPAVTVPYWNWSVDRTPTAVLWGNDFLGGDGRAGDRRVLTGPFAASTGNWTLTVRADSRTYLVRSMGLARPALPTAADLAAVMLRSPYDTAPWSESSTVGFRAALEGFVTPNLHNNVHLWVGGHMLQTVSPNDPVFFLHHAFVDKCWADWCGSQTVRYLPATNTPNVVDADELLPPWNDHTPYYTYG